MKKERRMSKLILTLVVSLMILTMSLPVVLASNTAEIDAIVGRALEIVWDTNYPLAFGTFLPGNGGTVEIDTAGARTVTGGVVELGGFISEAQFNVSGEPGKSISISLPDDATIAHVDDEEITMSVDNFVSSPNAGGTLDSEGTVKIHVGATLNVDADQLSGTYKGEFDVTVSYE